ncbi:hypothetical protein EBB05_23460 [Methylobacterium brachiatum]|nr:hypothetical protein EBB05_23460 [Methylobacterium brachiatum]
MRERDRVRGATSPESPDPSPQPSPARERGHVAAFTRRRALQTASSVAASEVTAKPKSPRRRSAIAPARAARSPSAAPRR